MNKNERLGTSRDIEPSHEPYHSSGIPANSSDDALERYASRIRQELRHKEMMELAEAAERAAEAGEESFAVRPSTFGSSDWISMDDSILKTPIASTITRPNMLTPLLVRKRIEKIGVTELRDVHEVFPDFGEFHTHLRTHLVRGGVDRKTTNEQGRRPSAVSSSGKNKGLNFLRDFNDWISPFNGRATEKEDSQSTCTSAWDIGNIISEHINLSTSKSPTSRGPSETTFSRKQLGETLPASLSEKRDALSSRRKSVRRALFDDDDFPQSEPETQTTENTQISNNHHQLGLHSTSRDVAKNRAEFVTPVRLRDIRRQSDTDDLFDGFPSFSSLIDSPSKMVTEREQREKVKIVSHDSRASISSFPVPRAAKLENEEKHMLDNQHERKTVEDSQDEAGEDMPINGFPIIGPLLLDGVASDLFRDNSRLEEVEADPTGDMRLNTQLLRLDRELKKRYTSSIQTPMPDECGCLSIPSSSSLESNEASSLAQDSQLPKLAIPHEDKSSFSGRVNPLVDLMSRMSPSRKVFPSMKDNRLYFRSKDNDAFLNNYLYCGKPIERCHNEASNHYLCSGQDISSTCIEFNVDSCCTAILPDTFTERKPATAQSFVSLGGTPSLKSEAEIWFDRATEGFDHFLEQLSGAQSTSGFSTWNVSFQAPSLHMRKVSGPHADMPATSAPTTPDRSSVVSGFDFDSPH